MHDFTPSMTEKTVFITILYNLNFLKARHYYPNVNIHTTTQNTDLQVLLNLGLKRPRNFLITYLNLVFLLHNSN